MPLPTTFPRLMLVCALLCLTALPAVSQASTSQSCLERCIPACRNASGGETGRAVCLGSCLGECPVYCGTVDTGCAQDCVNTSILDTTRDDKSLAVACARACTIKPNCPPPPEVKVLRAPPAASGKAPARAKVTLRIKKKDMDETFVARDRSFSVVVPWDWDLAEDSGLGPDGDYELKATAPDAEFLNYVLFAVRHVSDPSRTAERFLSELEHPRFAAAGRKIVFSKVRLDGREVTQAEERSVRTLATFPDQVPNLVRTMVLPLPVGFMVLTADVPLAVQDKYGAQIERIFQSFRLLAAPPSRRAGGFGRGVRRVRGLPGLQGRDGEGQGGKARHQ